MLKNTGERLILEQSWNVMSTLEHLHRYRAVTKLIKGKVVLDAACGTGYGTYQLSKYARKVYGIDISSDAINYAREKYSNNNLSYEVMSIEDLKFANNKFDVITSFETIEHITKDLQNKFLVGAKQKLKNNGILIISTPNDQLMREWTFGAYKNEFHLCEFEEKEYESFLKQHFKYVEIFYQTVTEVSSILKKGEHIEDGAIYSMENINSQGRYYIAICSDRPIRARMSLESVLLPCLDEYFNEEYYTKQCMLFVDSGFGFSDNEKIIGEYITKDNKSFECRFSLEDYKNIKQLRFDLCEHGGKIIIDSVHTNIGELVFEPVNATNKEQGFDVFMTLDPQYVTKESNLEGITEIIIRGKMDIYPDHIILTSYEKNKIAMESRIDELEAQVAFKNSQEKEFRKYIEYLEGMCSQIGSYQTEVSRYIKELEAKELEIEKYEKKVSEYEKIIGNI